LPQVVYPVDYGYLADTQGGDGEGIDLWVGSAAPPLRGLVATFDPFKANAEVKYLFALSDDEFASAPPRNNSPTKASSPNSSWPR